MINGILGFLLGMFVGTFGGFILCALAVTANRDDRRRERDYEEFIKYQEDLKDDGK